MTPPAAGGDLHGAGDVSDGNVAGRARHRRQRLVLPTTSARSSSGASRTSSSSEPKIWEIARELDPELHLRQSLLVVQHVLVGRLRGHAAADVPGRWPQAARHLHPTCVTARRRCRSSWVSSRSSSSGDPTPTISATQWIADAAMWVDRALPADAQSRLPAPPGLQPAAHRAGRPAHRR